MIAAVFDCMVYVQAALGSKGPAFACLSLAEQNRITLHLSPAILEEVKRTLDRPSLRRRYSKLTDERVERFLERIVIAGKPSDDPPHVFSLPRDPKDEPYLDLAIATQASFIVSRDKDLLSLMDDDAFKSTYPGLSIVEPHAFLARIRAGQSQQTDTP